MKNSISFDEFISILEGKLTLKTNDNSLIKNKVLVQNQRIDISNVSITGYKFKKNENFLKINNSVFLNNVDFVDEVVLKKIIFEKKLSFVQVKFKKYFEISSLIASSLNFFNCDSDDKILLNDFLSINKINFINGNYNKIIIRGGFLEELNFESNINELKVYAGYENETYTGINDYIYYGSVSKLFIKKIFLKGNLRGNVLFEGFISDNIILQSLNLEKDCKMSFEKGSLNSLLIENLRNKGEIKLINILNSNYEIDNEFYENQILKENLFDEDLKKYMLKTANHSESILRLANSELGYFDLFNCEIDRFNKIVIINTRLSSIKTFNSSFPVNKIERWENGVNLYEIFIDLFTVSKSKNNKFEELEYYKAAQRHLYQRFNNKNNFLLSLFYSEDKPGLFSLGISKLYSNFGTSWPKSFFFITPLLAGIFFIIMLLSSHYNIEYSTDGLNELIRILPFYIQFLNPIHRIDFLDTEIIKFSNNFYFVFFDFLGRIFISIGIYETIISFRRFTLK